jgi:hypothetical protein
MQLSITNEEEWIKEQINILNEEHANHYITLTSKEDVLKWLDATDLIQTLTEDFDYSATLSETTDFSNEEFSKQFIELFQELKNKIVDKFCKETLELEV